MRGVNMAVLVGNLGNDPEMKYMQDGTAVCTMSVATSEQWKDKTSGEKKERTEWHKIKSFGKTAEACGEYLRKGSPVFVRGMIRTDKFTGQDGVEKYFSYIRVDMGGEIQFLPNPNSERTAQVPAQRREPSPQQGDSNEAFADDDIPFN